MPGSRTVGVPAFGAVPGNSPKRATARELLLPCAANRVTSNGAGSYELRSDRSRRFRAMKTRIAKLFVVRDERVGNGPADFGSGPTHLIVRQGIETIRRKQSSNRCACERVASSAGPRSSLPRDCDNQIRHAGRFVLLIGRRRGPAERADNDRRRWLPLHTDRDTHGRR